MSNKIIKPVSFNKLNDKGLLKHIEGLNFSGYVKQLIHAEIKTQEKKKAQIEAGQSPIKVVGGEIKFKF